MKIESFPLLAAATEASKSPWGQKSLRNLIQVLNTYTETIPNPIFNDAKSNLNTVVDIARSHQGIYQAAFSEAYKFEPASYQLDFMYANQVAGKVKLATKKGFQNPTWFAICAEITVLYTALQSLKDKVVKRQVRSEEERADDYVPALPTTKAAKQVEAILKEMTDGLTKEYADQLFAGFTKAVEYEIANPIPMGSEKYNNARRHGVSTHHSLMAYVGANFDSMKDIYLGLVPEYKEIIRKRADADADFAQRMFLYKNVMKLATILEDKGNFSSHSILEGRVNHNGFQGEIVFYFADGSKFVVRNKVVVKYSVNGKGFQQFPTTFHRAVLAGGNQMPGQPSEEDMKEVFAKGA